MVTTVRSHHNEEEADEDEEGYQHFASITPNDSSLKRKAEGRSCGQKLRSKHSETEQRRRSKINERFQILRDLIPENDQKRDKASFLLEVIQHVQFLQEKLQIYEGDYHGWSPEPLKLTPWRSNSLPVENFVEQPALVKNYCNQEDIARTQGILTNSQNSVESDLHESAVYKLTEHHTVSEDHVSEEQTAPLNMPMQPNMFESMATHHQVSDIEHFASHSQSQYLSSKWSLECNIPNCTPNELEILRSDSGEADISSACSQGLLNCLTRALQSSGVDLSQASISVRLDMGKQTNSGIVSPKYSTKDHENQPGVELAQYATSSESNGHGNERLRTGYN